MARFSKVSANFWRSRRVAALSNDDRLCLLYCITAEHQTSVGAARIPTKYAAADLAWTEEAFEASVTSLVDAGLLLRDPETLEIFVTGWFRHNAPQNPNHASGMVKAISEISSDAIREAVEAEFETVNRVPAPTPKRSKRPSNNDSDHIDF
ncbi:hypothetical protein FE840_001440 [Peteryoungia desertarenae]|uniref:Uncharacterized protein n=1 Tax=Peteryoungia desertarenae TaxID=1813451 RepID=A0ABX6QIE1_9HYPH|nr:hypothetical protein [Peteryoungia desertarenae]QLF68323.1 hypothetical protein FE840_001440 [Peteryoungia desertarenae]